MSYNPYKLDGPSVPEDDQEPREPPTCKFCGKTDLDWVFTGVRWRLVEGTKIHVCGNDHAIDDFDTLS